MFSQLIINILVPHIIGQAKEGEEKKNIVYLSPICFLIGIIDAVLFLGLLLIMVFSPDDAEPFWAYIICGALILLGLIIVLYSLLWRIEYNDVTFTYRSFLGHRTSVKYADIVKIKRNENYVYLYTNKQRINFILGSIGDDDFLDMIAKHALVAKSIVESRKKEKKQSGKTLHKH